MFDAKDVALLRGMFEEFEVKFDQKLEVRDRELREHLEQRDRDLKHDIRDEMHSVVNAAVSASEARTMKKMDTLKEEMHTIKEEIIDGITDILDESVLPRLDAHDREFVVIKQVLKLA